MRLRLALLDLDGTLKQERDPYMYLHRRLGTEEQGQELLRSGLAGQIAYAQWLSQDVALWAGQPVDRVRRLLDEDPYVLGAPDLLRALKEAGLFVAVISSGLTLHAQMVQVQFGLDYVLASEAVVADGRLTGEARERLPEGGKEAVADLLMGQLGLGRERVLAVGDSSSDIALFQRAGLSVAVQPSSDEVRAAADLVLERPDLRPLLALLTECGFRAAECRARLDRGEG